MSKNWYKAKPKKRKVISISDNESFLWEDTKNIDNSYNIVSVSMKGSTHHFYLWSSKTVSSARELYNSKKYKKSIGMLKKYAFDINTV